MSDLNTSVSWREILARGLPDFRVAYANAIQNDNVNAILPLAMYLLTDS